MMILVMRLYYQKQMKQKNITPEFCFNIITEIKMYVFCTTHLIKNLYYRGSFPLISPKVYLTHTYKRAY